MPLGAIEKRALRSIPAADRTARRVAAALHADARRLTPPAARRAISTSQETGGRLGFITPLTHNFCESCNRVRVTCTGTLYMCLGQDDAADLREPLRRSQADAPLESAIRAAILRKPKGHDFLIERTGSHASTGRHMSVTGG